MIEVSEGEIQTAAKIYGLIQENPVEGLGM